MCLMQNVVVVVRVEKVSKLMRFETRVYVRTGILTQPYELSDGIEAYMLKRREDSQVVVQQILTDRRSQSY